MSEAIIKQRHKKHLHRVADAIMEIRRVRRDMIIEERKIERRRREFEQKHLISTNDGKSNIPKQSERGALNLATKNANSKAKEGQGAASKG